MALRFKGKRFIFTRTLTAMGALKFSCFEQYRALEEAPIFDLYPLEKQYSSSKNRVNCSTFGVQLSGRNFVKSGAREYRRGYQGSEEDDEVKGDGNSYTTEYRFLDPRLGRWLTIDPLTAQTPWESPYVSMGNNPVGMNDPLGLSATGKGSNPEPKKYRWPRMKAIAFALVHGGGKSDLTKTENGYIVNYDAHGWRSGKGEASYDFKAKSFKGDEDWVEDERGKRMIANGEWNGHGIWWHREDESWYKWKRQCDNVDRVGKTFMYALAGLVCAPGVAAGYTLSAPIISSGIVATGVGLFKTGKLIYQGISTAFSTYHKTFGTQGGYVSLGREVLSQTATQFGATGTVDPSKYNAVGLVTSMFVTDGPSKAYGYSQGIVSANLSLNFKGETSGFWKHGVGYNTVSTFNSVMGTATGAPELFGFWQGATLDRSFKK